jgi:hemerythrin
MNFKIDFNEPMLQMIERLKREHVQLLPKLKEVESVSINDVEHAISMMDNLRDTIMRHAVEEEARVMRVIMQKEKIESAESVRIMQEHRWVSEFLERRLKELSKEPPLTASSEILKFINDLRVHFREEEEIVFPLAIRALN